MDRITIEHWMGKLDEDRDRLLIATTYINEGVERSAILRALTALELDIQKIKEEVER